MHRMDSALITSNYSAFCFLPITQYVTLDLLYCSLFKLCSKDKIINFLTGFPQPICTMVSNCLTNINELALAMPL